MFSLRLQLCEPGWGYDCKTGLFIPIDDVKNFKIKPKLLQTCSFTENYEIESFLSTFFNKNARFSNNEENFIHWIKNDNPNFLKILDFFIPIHEISAFISNVCFLNKTISTKRSKNYPKEATHFVESVDYGLKMWIIFDKKNNHLFENDENGHFLDNIWENGEKLTKEQENVECSVLIFAEDPEETTVKQMTIKDILQMRQDFVNGNYPELEYPLECELSELCEDINYPENNNKMIKIVMASILVIFSFQKWLKNKESSVFQKLLEIEDLSESNENLTQTLNLSKKFFKRLWSQDISEKPRTKSITIPQNIDVQTIIMDKNSMFTFKREILQRLKMGLTFLNNVDEPYTWNSFLNKKMLLGFAVNQKKFTTKAIETSEMFVSVCPENCSNDLRQWICTNCGNFFKINGFEVVCDCGTTHVSNLNFECCNSKHEKSSIFCQKANVSNFTDDQKSILVTIKQQLQKLANQGNATSAEKINSVIQSINLTNRLLIS